MLSVIDKLFNLYEKKAIQYVIGISIIIFFTICYIVLLLNKYWQFEFLFTDNVYFDTALWKMAHFQSPIVTHSILGKINIFGDHFHPIILLSSIIYMFTDKKEVILASICILYGISAYFGMIVGFKLLKNKIFTYILLIAYFLYLGTQNALIYGFHEVDFMPLFFFLMLYAFFYNRSKLFWASFILLLLTKESMVFITICIGFFIFFDNRKNRKKGAVIILFSILYFFLVTRVVIPHFSGRYLYTSYNFPTNINDFVFKLTQPQEKIDTLFVSMSTFAFLPLFNLLTLPLILQDIVSRYVFALPGTLQYQLYYHYNIVLAPLLFFSSAYSLYLLQKNRLLNKYLFIFSILMLFFSFYYLRFYKIKGPLLMVFMKDFYLITNKNKFLWKLVDHTPKDGSVMTQNHLAYIFAHNDVYLMPHEINMTENLKTLNILKPEYIVYDLRQGQNPNNYFPLTEDDAKKITARIINQKLYKILYNEGSMYILKRI